MLAGAHKKFYRVQHAEIYLLDLKVQYKHKIKLSLGMVSKHVLLYLCLPDYYIIINIGVNQSHIKVNLRGTTFVHDCIVSLGQAP